MNDNLKAQQRQAVNEPALVPAVDVFEDAEGLTLIADLPGVDREHLALTVEAGTLTIEGTIAFAQETQLKTAHAEVSLPRYRRVFALSRDLDGERIAAELHEGVLKLRIPKAAHALPRRVEIQAA